MSGAKGQDGCGKEIKFVFLKYSVNGTPLCIRLNCVVMLFEADSIFSIEEQIISGKSMKTSPSVTPNGKSVRAEKSLSRPDHSLHAKDPNPAGVQAKSQRASQALELDARLYRVSPSDAPARSH
jgi:hypothetical protein